MQVLNVKNKKKVCLYPPIKVSPAIYPTLTIRTLEIPFSGELLQMDFSILLSEKNLKPQDATFANSFQERRLATIVKLHFHCAFRQDVNINHN